MMEAVLRHCTDMEIQRQDVDSHGQSAVGFALCRRVGFELAPRLKAIARQKLALPDVGMRTRPPHLQPILSSPINWAEIAQHYDAMFKYAVAIQTKTDAPEAILPRSRRPEQLPPTSKTGKESRRVRASQYVYISV